MSIYVWIILGVVYYLLVVWRVWRLFRRVGERPGPIALAGNALVAAVIVPLLLTLWTVGVASFALAGFLTGGIDGAADAGEEAASIITTRRR